MKDRISASFTWTLSDFIAAQRANQMILNSSYDTIVMRAALLFFGHLLLLVCPLFGFLIISGNLSPKRPIPPGPLASICLMSLVAGCILFVKWYGYRWLMERAFRSSPVGDGLKQSFVFSPKGFESTNRLVETKQSWVLFKQMVEFRDGFMLIGGSAGTWIPKSAFDEPFDDVEFTELAKSCIAKYKFIDRRAALSR